MEKVTTMEEFFLKGNVVFEATTYIKKNGRQQLESCWCAKESPKHFRSICCGCEKGTIKGISCVFAVFVTGR